MRPFLFEKLIKYMSFFKRLPKFIFIGSVVVVGLSGAFVYGVLAHRSDLPPVPTMRAIYLGGAGTFADPVMRHVQPARGPEDGVIRNRTEGDDLVFMVGFFEGENQARLIERDGTVHHGWSLDYLEHFPDETQRACNYVSDPLDVDMHGALLTEAGDLIFNYEYCGTVKLDRCGNVVWTLADDSHHSLTRAEAGGYWLLGRHKWLTAEEPDRFPPFSNAPKDPGEIQEDTIMLVSEQGEVLEETSIPVMMRDSGLLPVLTATGDNFTRSTGGRRELVHANKVSELPVALADAYPLFEAGDLAISMRELNLVMVVDRESKAVKWHQVGPWLRQHDPEFRPDGRISIFNNNIFRNAYAEDQVDLRTPFSTNIIVIDPVTRETEVIFGEAPGEEMLSVIRGQHELLPGGGMIISEFDGGKVIEVNGEGEVVWEYVNRHDENYVGEITNAEVYARSYFRAGLSGDADCQ